MEVGRAGQIGQAGAVQRDSLPQIRPVLGGVDDVRLAPASVDLAIMVDVYHELAYPYEVMSSLVKALKPGGRVVFVEYKAEDPLVPIKPLHKMSKAQVNKELTANGFKLVQEFDKVDHVVRVELAHGFCQHMGAVMADEFKGFRIITRHDAQR